ncbi:MAG: beta-N-acetylhexosaminidase [Clostridia bacterium]|nr:beta-N-acetylhexosaminidase [Clostridia bacterium]
MNYNLVPYPKKIEISDELLYLGGLEIVLNAKCDSRIFKAAKTLKTELEAETGISPKINKAFAPKNGTIRILVTSDENTEAYSIKIDENGVELTAKSQKGAFYAIQTLRQLIKGSSGYISYLEIEDEPDMENRGFYHDVSRGRVPTVEGEKKLIDILAYYKINSLQVYIEHAFDFEEYRCFLDPEGYLTAEEILELDDYCYENFIDFVPSLSTFGHLYRLLETKEYKHLCELEEFEHNPNMWKDRMLHHTIDASNPESFALICSLIDQYIPLFRSEYFNICCDETFDLCNGRNKGKDKAALYLEFTTKLIDYVSSKGKRVMMWGDIALNHPEIIPSFPKDTIMLCWDYANTPNVANIEKFAESGMTQMVCPGCSSWNHFCEVINYAKSNIVGMIDGGVKNGAMGVLNTAWGDYGHVCPLNCTLYGLVLGAARSWNNTYDVYSPKYETAVGELLYNDKTGKTVDLVKKLGDLEQVMSWGLFVLWHYGEMIYWGDFKFVPENAYIFADNAQKCFEIADELRKLGKGEMYFDLALTAEATAFVNLAAARILDKRTLDCRSAFLKWCEDYEKSWRRDNKTSDLFLITDILRRSLFD